MCCDFYEGEDDHPAYGRFPPINGNCNAPVSMRQRKSRKQNDHENIEWSFYMYRNSISCLPLSIKLAKRCSLRNLLADA